MATGSFANVVRAICRPAIASSGTATSDDTLLDRFLREHDEAAFEILVRRHGRMVLGVCQRILGHSPDAEDAFQAVFLVLVRKADAIVPRELIGHWLYGVAYRTSLRVRSLTMRRRQREKQVSRLPEPEVADPESKDDLRAILDQELMALPEKFRTAIVLCDLNGQTKKEVAQQLRVPDGTISSRLARGRDLLRKRLAKRGIALSVAGLAGVLAQNALASTIPGVLLDATIRAACIFAAGEAALAGSVSTPITTIAEGVMKSMFATKRKILAVLVAVIIAGTGFGFISKTAVGNGQTTAPTAEKSSSPTKAQRQAKVSDDDPIRSMWITDKRVQAELRLSEDQIKKVNEVRAEVYRKHAAELKEAREQAKEHNYKRALEVQNKVHAAENKAIQEEAPKILSESALKRLRQIQLQARGRHNLLRDLAFQKKLNLNDEQMKQIEPFLKEGLEESRKEHAKRITGSVYLPLTIEEHIVTEERAYAAAMKKVLEVFSDPQKRLWNEMLGERFEFKSGN